MNNKLIYLIYLLAAVLSMSGCTQIRQDTQPVPSVQAKSGKDKENRDQDLSVNFYYLESRMHIKNNETDKALASLEKARSMDPESFVITWDLINLYLRDQNTEKAVEAAEDLVRINPDSVEALLLLIDLKKDTMEEKELIDTLNRVLSLDPENKEAFLRLGKTYLEKEAFEESRELFEKMTEQFPDYYVAFYYLGEIYMAIKDYERAQLQFLKTIELEPDLIEPRLQLIECLKQGPDPGGEKNQMILDYYKEILDMESDNIRARMGLGLHYYKNRMRAEAGDIFMDLGRSIEKNPHIAVIVVDDYIGKKKYQDAVIIFSEMLKANPGSSTLNFFTGMAYETKGDFKSAVFYLKKIKPDYPQYKKALIRIAYLHRQMNESQAARAFLEDKIRAFPDDIDLITFLASFYEQDGMFEKAFDILNQGLDRLPENTNLLFKLGAVQDKAGLKEEGISTMTKILQIDPDDAGALNYIGYTWADQGIRLNEALTMIQKAHDLKPDDGYITDSLGWVYYRMGDYEKSVIYLQEAADLTDYETIIADHLGDALQKTGQIEKALETYEKAIANAEKEDDDLVKDIQKKIDLLRKQLHE